MTGFVTTPDGVSIYFNLENRSSCKIETARKMTNREYLAAKHSLAEEPIVLPSECSIHEAEALVVAGNWFGAADAYSRIESAFGSDLNPIDRARLLARSAPTFPKWPAA